MGSDQREKRAFDDGSEIQWQRASQWISRTFAVVVVMIAPGILGSILDKQFNTQFLAALGFVLGLVLGTVGLVVLAKRFTPQARGQPLEWDDEQSSESSEESERDQSSNP